MSEIFAAYASSLARGSLLMAQEKPGAAIILLTQAIEFIIQGMSQDQIIALPLVTSEVVAFIQSQVARHEQGKIPS